MSAERASALTAAQPAEHLAGLARANLRSYLLPLVLICAALGARWLAGPRTIDDSFITFRYAQNILAGNGFVYNPGEQVLGTTTPLFTILLTGLGAITGGANAPFPVLALGVSALADCLTCLLLAALGRRLGSPLAGLGAALVWAVAPFSVTFASGGLETSLYVLLLTALAYCHLAGRRLLAASCAALAFLTRPDALILLGLVAIDRAILLALALRSARKLGQPTRALWMGVYAEAGVFLLLTLPWILFAALYFGSPIPHSLTAKSVAYRLPAEAAFVRLLQHYATPFLEHLTFGVVMIAVGLALYPFLFLVGALRGLRRSPRIWPFLAYPWLYFALFALANPLIFRWYLTPPLPAYFLAILMGLETLARPPAHPSEKRGSPPSGRFFPLRPTCALLLVLFIPLLLTLRGWTLRPDHGLNQPAPEMAFYQLELLYRQAAETVNLDISSTQARPNLTLAAGDVGVLGYYTGLRILDTVGLNSPQATRYYPLDPALYTINYAVPPGLILDEQPDYVVILEVYGRAGLLKDPRFSASYRLIDIIPTELYGSQGLLIFRRYPRN
jgi:hypothetical protein